MQTYYSILYTPIRQSFRENLSIALLLHNGNESHFRYSKEKLNIIKKLIPSAPFSMLQSYLKSIEKEIGNLSADITNKLKFRDTETDEYLSASYFSYLSKYSNNLLAFSEPQAIDLEINEKLFDKLFEKMVFENSKFEIALLREDVHSKIRMDLYPKIQNRVNIEKKLTTSEFPDLFASVKVDFIGKNEIPVVGQSFDFTKRHNTLENEVARLVGLTKAIELNGERNGKYYVIGNEPSKKSDPHQHRIWKSIHTSNYLDFVPFKELNKIEEYIEEHQVEKYFED